jgi:hypothetical protein
MVQQPSSTVTLVFTDLAEVLSIAGRSKEAADALEQALERYEREENVVMAGRTRRRLAELERVGS